MLVEVGFRGDVERINLGGYGKNLWQGALSARTMKRREQRRIKRQKKERRPRKEPTQYIPGLTETDEHVLDKNNVGNVGNVNMSQTIEKE